MYDFTVVLSSGTSMTTVVNDGEATAKFLEELISRPSPRFVMVGADDYFPIHFRTDKVDGFTYALHEEEEDEASEDDEAEDDEADTELSTAEGMNL